MDELEQIVHDMNKLLGRLREYSNRRTYTSQIREHMDQVIEEELQEHQVLKVIGSECTVDEAAAALPNPDMMEWESFMNRIIDKSVERVMDTGGLSPTEFGGSRGFILCYLKGQLMDQKAGLVASSGVLRNLHKRMSIASDYKLQGVHLLNLPEWDATRGYLTEGAESGS